LTELRVQAADLQIFEWRTLGNRESLSKLQPRQGKSKGTDL